MMDCRSLFRRRKVSLSMHTYPSEHKRQQRKAPGSRLQRFLFILMLLNLVAIIVCLLVIEQLWHSPTTPAYQPTPPPVVALSPQPSPTPFPSPTPTANLAQRIDAYI